jgi:asparagine synthase (glutamine-hydrolysing)
MCGICGTLSLRGEPADVEVVRAMMRRIRHRGPDGSGVHGEPEVALGHVRLSIIDIAGGSQPMSTADGSVWITFNGEIFNYLELREELLRKGCRFRTRSDTEVLLQLYRQEGEQCVTRLNGQWAFAIWDRPARKLFLSRDRLGVRPLFYAETPGHLHFASEIKALFACPDVDRTLDLEALQQVFTFWVTLPPQTAFRKVRQLPPGHSLVVEQGQLRVFPHWRLDIAPREDLTAAEERRLPDQLRELLCDATRIRLRSDVPVGSYLSGGLDSTLVSAFAAKAAPDRLRTFSIGFTDAALDETPHQKAAAAFLGASHTRVECTREDIARVFSDVIWHAEQPVLRAAPAPLFLLSRQVRESGFKVVLTGEGADEMFGGYDIFKETKIRLFWSRRPASPFRPLLLRRLYPYMEGMQRQPAAYRNHFFRVSDTDCASPFFSHLPRWQLTAGLQTFFSPEVKAELRRSDPVSRLEQTLPGSFRLLGPFSRAEYLEAAYLLPGYILSAQGDRMAMAHAVEARHPFLDHRVVAFAAALPLRCKMKVLCEKFLLKQAGQALVPESVRGRHKQPYRAPDGVSFFGAFPEHLEALSPERIRRHGIFDPAPVSALVRKFQVGRATGTRDNMALVGILSTEILLDRFVDSAGL